MYSFGRKHRFNVLNNGFIEENFNRGLFAVFPNARCLVLEITVTEEQYQTMLESVELFLRRQEMYRYNIAGLLGYMLGIRLTPKDRFFCSQFVAYILGRTGLWPGVPELTKPMDFLRIQKRSIIFEGTVKQYKTLRALENESQRLSAKYKSVLSLMYLAAKIRETSRWLVRHEGGYLRCRLLWCKVANHIMASRQNAREAEPILRRNPR